MTFRKIVFASLSTALMAAAAVASASPAPASTPTDACVFSKYQASTVRPLNGEDNYGYGSYTTLKGAQVFVPAREGLTEQWLARDVERALASSGAASCQANVHDVKVQVVSGGSGFWVQLTAANEATGQAALELGARPRPDGTSVSVRRGRERAYSMADADLARSRNTNF